MTRRSRAGLAAVAVVVVAGCGSRATEPQVAKPTSTPAVESPSTSRPSGTASASPRGRLPTILPTEPDAGPSASRTGAAGRAAATRSWCSLRPAWECIDAATAHRWWPASQIPEPPPRAPHSYVVYGRRGARLDTPPSVDRGSSLSLVLHRAGETPRELRQAALVRKGAIVLSVRMRDRFDSGPVPPSMRYVTVRGQRAHLMHGDAHDDDHPLRMVLWTERRGDVWFVWMSIDSQRFRSDEELVATLNSLGRS